jgi:hypothetical protein
MPGNLQQRGHRDWPQNNDRSYNGNYQRGRSNNRERQGENHARWDIDRHHDNDSRGSTDQTRDGVHHRDSSYDRYNNGRSRDTVQQQRRQQQRRENSPSQGHNIDNSRGRHQETTTPRNGTTRATFHQSTTATAPDDVTTRPTSGSDPAFTALWTGLARSIQCRHHQQIWQEVPTFIKRNVNNLLRHVNPPGANDVYRRKMALIGIEFCNKITAATSEHIINTLEDNDAKLTHPNMDTLERAQKLAASNTGRRLKRMSSADLLKYAAAAASRSKRFNNSTNEPSHHRHAEAMSTSTTTGLTRRMGPSQPPTSAANNEDDDANWTLVQNKHHSTRRTFRQTPPPHTGTTASTTNKKRKAASSRNSSPTTDLESLAPADKLVVTAMEESATDNVPINDNTVDCNADNQPTTSTTRRLPTGDGVFIHDTQKNVFIVEVPCPTNMTSARRRHLELLNSEMSEFVTHDVHIPPPTHDNVKIATTDKAGIHHTPETTNRILQSIAEAAIGRVFPPLAAC